MADELQIALSVDGLDASMKAFASKFESIIKQIQSSTSKLTGVANKPNTNEKSNSQVVNYTQPLTQIKQSISKGFLENSKHLLGITKLLSGHSREGIAPSRLAGPALGVGAAAVGVGSGAAITESLITRPRKEIDVDKIDREFTKAANDTGKEFESAADKLKRKLDKLNSYIVEPPIRTPNDELTKSIRDGIQSRIKRTPKFAPNGTSSPGDGFNLNLRDDSIKDSMKSGLTKISNIKGVRAAGEVGS